MMTNRAVDLESVQTTYRYIAREPCVVRKFALELQKRDQKQIARVCNEAHDETGGTERSNTLALNEPRTRRTPECLRR